ncbi:MAG: hypothetical protein ACRDLV_07650, partial [Solirubrobacteraceae bacterium]
IYDQTGTVSAPFVFDHDAFATDGDPGQQVGGLSLVLAPATCSFSPGADLTLTNSTFTNDTAQTGAGAYIMLECPAAESSHVTATVADNTFTGDSASTTGFAGGGGLAIGAIAADQPGVPIDLTQRANLFQNDSVTGTGTQLAGGGEYTAGVNLISVDDRFIDNALSGPTASGEWSWGAGLATFGGGECINSASVSSTLANAIVAGNSIGAPVSPATGADAVGAGIYAGCTPTVDSVGYHLTTIDSTVSGNSVTGSPTGAVAGIDGETGDFLNLQNTIVDGDLGGAEIGGFGATDGANATATYSDVCSLTQVTQPYAGAGNVCAAPALADAATGDVHETAASPTVDAGSNALVPGSLSTDAYGGSRIVAVNSPTATVDIGAAELAPVPVSETPPTITGAALIDQTLQASTGVWSYQPTSYAYQWERCDGSGANCAPIASATAGTYSVATADLEHALRVVVTATNPAGSASAVSSPTQSVPVSTGLPKHFPPVCPSYAGRVTGASLGGVTLGMSKARVGRANRQIISSSAHQERLCVPGGSIQIGYAYARLEAGLSRHARLALGSAVVWIATGDRHYSVRGLHPGLRLSRHRRLPRGLGRPLRHRGANWYVLRRGRHVTALVEVRHRAVAEVAIAAPSLAGTTARLRLLLAAFG